MATIQKRKAADGRVSYRAMVRLKGHPAQYATFARKTDAKDWAKQTEAAIKEGRYFATREAKRHTVSELLERYEVECLDHRPAKQRRDVKRMLRWWSEQTGDLLLADITPARISELRGVLSRGSVPAGGTRSAATVNRYLAALSHPFSVAVREWGWVEFNPVLRVAKLKEPRGRVRFLSDEERVRLLAACEASQELRLYPLVVLALSTGARQGEILGLAWSDIEFDRGVAVLHHTKNRERRAVPLAGEALRLVRELSKVRRIDSRAVFASLRGKPTFPRRAWKKALEEAEIEDFRFHDLRHSAASYLAMSGATLAEIADVLGHKTLDMVKRYSHLSEQHTTKVVTRMNQQIFGGKTLDCPAG